MEIFLANMCFLISICGACCRKLPMEQRMCLGTFSHLRCSPNLHASMRFF